MVTTSKATLALILMALVGCGPKPAGYHIISGDANNPADPLSLKQQNFPLKQHDFIDIPGPPIDPNPYRFIGGQLYGEGWERREICEVDPSLRDCVNGEFRGIVLVPKLDKLEK